MIALFFAFPIFSIFSTIVTALVPDMERGFLQWNDTFSWIFRAFRRRSDEAPNMKSALTYGRKILRAFIDNFLEIYEGITARVSLRGCKFDPRYMFRMVDRVWLHEIWWATHVRGIRDLNLIQCLAPGSAPTDNPRLELTVTVPAGSFWDWEEKDETRNAICVQQTAGIAITWDWNSTY